MVVDILRRAACTAQLAFGVLAVACGGFDPKLLPSPVAGGGAVDSGLAGSADGGGPVAPGADAGPSCGPLDTLENCGACGQVCSVEHGEAACARGTCAVVACDDGYVDCDGEPLTCETSSRSLAVCGGCNQSCRDVPHAVPDCATGSCAIARCEAGFADCDESADNGCETALDTLEDCGRCGVRCAKQSCAGGICTAADCAEGEGDCDGDEVTCETNLHADPRHCGRCDAACAFGSGITPNGSLACTPEGCAVTCDAAFVDCDADYRTGCEAPLVDTDGDDTPDCKDSCPDDPGKQQPGTCGCGVPDTDGDGDGTLDCDDGCPVDPTQAGECLGFTPTHFDPTPIDWSAQPSATLDCGTTTLDTTDPDGSGPLVATLTNWCGTDPQPLAQDQSGGPQLVIVPLRGLQVLAGQTLRVIGARPAVLAVDGDVSVAGTLDANASGTTPGAGGNQSCGGSAGGNGSGSTGRFDGASGGGGGGFGTAGGRAGTADTDGRDVPGGIAGVARGNAELNPLLGGCAGGRAGGCSTAGGGGGGAVQLTASGAISVSGTLRANGANGATPCGQNDEGGGTGGGSGGALLLEATALDTGGGTLQVNGGRGGANGQYVGIYDCGAVPGGNGATSASTSGQNGVNCQGGSPGGGGGYGRIRSVMR